jgi:PAS domain S-box-containing protein
MHSGFALLLLFAQMLSLTGMVLALFWLRRYIGVTPLFVSLGVLQPVQVMLWSSVYVELLPGVSVSPGTLMFAAILLAVLLVYIREDASVARKLIYGVIGASLAMTMVMLLVSIQIQTPGTSHLLDIPPQVFSQGAQVSAVSTLVFIFDVLLLVFIYLSIHRYIPTHQFLCVFFALTGALMFDAVVFTTAARFQRSDFPLLLSSAVLSRLLIVPFFSVALIIYLRYVEPAEMPGAALNQSFGNLFRALTFREKFDLQARTIDEVEARLEKAQQIARMGFLDWDLKTNLIYWSNELVRLIGFDPGHNVQTLEATVNAVHPDDRAMAQASIARAVKGEAAHRIDHRLIRSDGAVIWVHAEGELIHDDEGHPIKFLGTMVDITQSKHAEEEIRRLNEGLEVRVANRTSQLESANKELESFTYSVSHDLRAPLRAVSGFSQIIARRHRSSLNDEGQRYVDNIVTASERMGRLIDDLLDYAKLGRKAVKLEPVSLSDVLVHVSGDLAHRIEQEGSHLVVAKDLPVVTGNATLLGQVFTNLLDNALTYKVSGKPAEVAVSWEVHAGQVLVHVADRGLGIPAEHHQKIFNVFQRLHRDEEYPGTGIGLAVVKKALTLLGGEVQIASEPGQGSTFTVVLPMYPQATA